MTDQEQTILKAIQHAGRGGPATIAQVIKAAGYPKATTKRVLVDLLAKGAVVLHRHDWPQSLTPAERKNMILFAGSYYGAVTVNKRNPQTKGKKALKTAGRAVKGVARAILGAGSQILGAGASALNPRGQHLPGLPRKAQREYEHILAEARRSGRYGKRKKEVAARTVEKQYGGKGMKKRAAKKNATVIKAKRVVIRKVINPKGPIPTPQNLAEYKILHEEYSRLRAGGAQTTAEKALFKKIKSAMARYEKTRPRAANKSRRKVVRSCNPRRKGRKKAGPIMKSRKRASIKARRRNLGHKDSNHPVEVKHHYRAGPPGYLTPWQRAHHAGQKDLFAHGITPAKRRNAARRRKGRRNPTATEIRKEFAGRAGAGRDLYFPKGTPPGELAKLGKLVLIKTDSGDIAPVAGVAWLCADERGKLHIGATKPAPLYSGPAGKIGKVHMIEYEETKPHLGYKNPTIWFHKLGEETGRRPTLHADAHGGLHIKGGAYRITRRGIEN